MTCEVQLSPILLLTRAGLAKRVKGQTDTYELTRKGKQHFGVVILDETVLIKEATCKPLR